MNLDYAIENRDVKSIMNHFDEDCEIELLGITLKGKQGVKKWLNWLFSNIAKIQIKPVIVMIEGDIYFEEFIVKARLKNGKQITSKQAEVLIYENYKVKSLRLYFDRLDFADAVAEGVLSKAIIHKLIKKSQEGLI